MASFDWCRALAGGGGSSAPLLLGSVCEVAFVGRRRSESGRGRDPRGFTRRLHRRGRRCRRSCGVAKVRGQFRKWSAELSFDEADLAKSSVGLTIDVDSVDTGNADRDGSLRSAGFFDAEKFPAITFRSRRV